MDNWSAEKEFLQTFRAEAGERLQNLGEGLMTLEGNPGDAELLKKLFREAHTLKGAAGMMGFDDIKELSHRAEDILSFVQKGQIEVNKGVTDLLLETLDFIEAMLPDPDSGQVPPTDISSLLERLVKAGNGEIVCGNRKYTRPQLVKHEEAVAEAESKAGDSTAVEQAPADKAGPETAPAARPVDAPAAAPRGADPTIRVNIERLDKLLNLMGEIIVNQIDSEGQVREMVALKHEARDLRDVFRSLVAEVEQLKHNAGPEEIAAFTRKLSQAENHADTVAGGIDAAASHFKENTASRRLALDELQDRTLHVRMLPVSTIFGVYPRVVRDVSGACGKKVRLETSGEETELDKRILEQITDPLMHIIRNCVDHGIEAPEARLAAGKPEQGVVRLTARQKGDRVEIEIVDDGAGIDPEKVRESAAAKGIIAPDEELTLEESMELIFRPGFSTAGKVTEISGRGVGLDVVKNNIEKLEGYVVVDSDPGCGTKFVVSLPVTLAVIKGLLVESGQARFVIPLASVKEMVAVPEAEIQTLGSHRGFLMRDGAIPMVDLLEYLGGGNTDNEGGKSHVVVVNAGTFMLGLEVGRLLGEQEVVIKPIGGMLGSLPYVAGVTILGNGEAVVVLNINRLARAVKEGNAGKTRARRLEEAIPIDEQRKKVLVVEDSLVVRELQRNILEAAGYEVDTAVDGEDALLRLSQLEVDCVVTDIEMPRMNGFDLTSALRKREEYRDTPIIMVTSCSSDSDKKRGIEVGADAYVVKGSFDQQNLLTTIERLVA